jgi:hypothetical protein
VGAENPITADEQGKRDVLKGQGGSLPICPCNISQVLPTPTKSRQRHRFLLCGHEIVLRHHRAPRGGIGRALSRHQLGDVSQIVLPSRGRVDVEESDGNVTRVREGVDGSPCSRRNADRTRGRRENRCADRQLRLHPSRRQRSHPTTCERWLCIASVESDANRSVPGATADGAMVIAE